jgi:outer membrane cobalamin receptor
VRKILVVTAASLVAGGAFAQEEQAAPSVTEAIAGKRDIMELSLDEFLDAKFEVAAKLTLTLRESPGVVTVLSHNEIMSIGARDLIDVLNLVPGFSPLIDSSSTFNVGFRGMINEGKVLLLIDGQEMNEVFYTSLRLVPRYPVDQIERIEIIRGPGSAIYGGMAELGVINVITRSAESQKGTSVVSTYGMFEGHGGRRVNVAASYANTFEELGGLSTSIALNAGTASHSAFRYTDFYGDNYVLSGKNSRYEPFFVNLGTSWKGVGLRLMYDGFRSYVRDVFDGSEPEPYRLHDRGFYAQLDYTWKLFDNVTITPVLRYKLQQPWGTVDPTVSAHFDKTADVMLGSVTIKADPLDWLNVLAGVEGYQTRAWLNSHQLTGFQTELAGDDHLEFNNVGAFAQALATSPFGNLTAGMRWEQNSEAGQSFVPRLAYTAVLDPFHVKLMYSQAFRPPSIENISLATEAGATEPEKTRAIEAELGAQIGDIAWVTANVFDVTIDDPIVYVIETDPDTGEDVEGYTNYKEMGTRGVEVEARLKTSRAWLTTSYSFYTSAGKNAVPNYAVPSRDDALLGTPKHKFVVYGSVSLTEGVRASTNVVYMSERYGYTDADVDADTGELTPIEGSADGGWLAGLFLTFENAGAQGLDIQLGVHNLFNTRFMLMPAFDGLHPPIPAQSREYLIKITLDEGMLAGAPSL